MGMRQQVSSTVSVIILVTVGSMLLPALNGKCTAMATDFIPQRRTALVTGGNKGIGKEIVRLLSSSSDQDDEEKSASWTIFLGSRDGERGMAAAEELSGDSNKGQIICCPLDLTDEASILAAKELIEKEGNGKLDVLINNAAVCFNDPTLYGKVQHTPFEEQADITVRTNFLGTLHVIQTMLPLLQKSTSPRIINIASAAGRLSILKSQHLVQAFTSKDLDVSMLQSLLIEFVQDVENGTHASKGWPNTCYGMSKLGIIALTKVLAREHPDIMVNSVDPGFCATDQNNNQGVIPAARGAVTPVVLATLPESEFVSGLHFYQEQEIPW
jgi:NAD(P)-dependent dehydrogenase (short-subunit alcohol dehydrogenase family)